MVEKARGRTRIVRTVLSKPLVTLALGGLVGLLAAILVDVTNADPGALVPDLGMPGWMATTLKLTLIGLGGLGTAMAFEQRRKSSGKLEKATSE